MYFVDKDKLTQKLAYLQALTDDYHESKHNHYAFERIAQMLIESSVDIGNMIIDAFILRDPGNYKDVIDILELENVITKETQQEINKTVDIRKQFTYDYTALDIKVIMPMFDDALPYYKQFITEVTTFLHQENVPVTAFGKGRKSIMKQYKAYLIDLDGTMYMGTDEIDGAKQFIDYLNVKGIPHLYVTNNSTKTPEQVTEKLREMHIDAKPEEVVTSALATADYISEQSPGASVYMLGGSGLNTALTEAGLVIKNDEHVDYVVIGLDEQVTYEKLAIATLGVRNGATFISTNPDVSIPKERGLLPGNGAITSVVSVSTGVSPQFIGKPEPIIMVKALEILGLDKSEVAMVGDLYDTDIMSGINVGMDTIHVQTGVSTLEDVQNKNVPPTYSFKDLNEAIAELEK